MKYNEVNELPKIYLCAALHSFLRFATALRAKSHKKHDYSLLSKHIYLFAFL